jgi:peptidoglycan/xylan/chitin deacetylase (PgdA/CDA1 family)
MVVTAEALAGHVGLLRAQGYEIVTAAQLAGELAAGGRGAGRAVLTFDDGWADALTVAAPVLADLGVRGTFYLCPGLFGNEEPRMSAAGRVLTAQEAGALHAAGMELGAHSVSHPDLVTIGDAELRAELEGSKRAVEEITGEPCRTFAHPFGSCDDRVCAATRAAGYELGLAYRPDLPWHAFAAPRTPMGSAT